MIVELLCRFLLGFVGGGIATVVLVAGVGRAVPEHPVVVIAALAVAYTTGYISAKVKD